MHNKFRLLQHVLLAVFVAIAIAIFAYLTAGAHSAGTHGTHQITMPVFMHAVYTPDSGCFYSLDFNGDNFLTCIR